MVIQPSGDDAPKTLKVRLPVRQHVQLQILKLKTGRNLSEVVQDALSQYLDRVMTPGMKARAALARTGHDQAETNPG